MTNSSKKVFIVTPIGGDNTDIRRAAEGVIDAVIIPILLDLEFKEENIAVAHRISTAGSINKQLITRIIEDDLVIANLTKLNPNVMYELAIRHAIRKPVVQICEDGTILPFDIVDERTIFYANDMKGVIDLGEGLKKYVSEALEEENPDNPIYRAIESQMIIQQSSPSEVSINEYLLSRLDAIEYAIAQNSIPNKNNLKRDNNIKLHITIFAKDQIPATLVSNDIRKLLAEYNLGNTGLNYSSSEIEAGHKRSFTIKIQNADDMTLSNIINNISNFDFDKYKVMDIEILPR